MSKDLVSEREEIKCSTIITYYRDDQKLIKFDDFNEENIKEYDQMWPQIFYHSYRISIINCSRSWKANSLFNLMSQQADIDKIYLYAKGPYEPKYQLINNKKQSADLKHFNDSKVFVE